MKTSDAGKFYKYLKDKDWKEVTITLVENYPCSTKDELMARETHYIEQYLNDPLCLNSNCALPTPASIARTIANGNARKAEYTICECGATVTRGYMNQHIKMKSHCEAMGLPFVDATAIRSAEALERQKQRAKEREHALIICECGAEIKYGSRFLHRKSKIHATRMLEQEPSLPPVE